MNEKSTAPGVKLRRLIGTVNLRAAAPGTVDGTFDVDLDTVAGIADVTGPGGTSEVEVKAEGDLIARMVEAATTAHRLTRLGHYEVYPGKDDEWRFRFRASNGRITSVGSEGYRDHHDAHRAAEDDAAQHGAVADIRLISSSADA